MSAGVVNFSESFEDPALQQYSQEYQDAGLRAAAFQQRHGRPSQRRLRAGDDGVPGVRTAVGQHDAASYDGRAEDGQHAVAADVRRRPAVLPAARRSAACWRCAGAAYKSWGDAANFNYFGGNADLRGYEYLQFIGNNTFYANAELRFPLVEAMLTPIGVLGGVRGVFFAGTAAPTSTTQPFQFWRATSRRPSSRSSAISPMHPANLVPVFGEPDRRDRATGSWTAAPRTASASRPSRSASRSTSTGRGGRC